MKKPKEKKKPTNKDRGMTGIRATATAAAIIKRIAEQQFEDHEEEYRKAGITKPSSKVVIDWLLLGVYDDFVVEMSDKEIEENQYLRIFGRGKEE